MRDRLATAGAWLAVLLCGSAWFVFVVVVGIGLVDCGRLALEELT